MRARHLVALGRHELDRQVIAAIKPLQFLGDRNSARLRFNQQQVNIKALTGAPNPFDEPPRIPDPTLVMSLPRAHNFFGYLPAWIFHSRAWAPDRRAAAEIFATRSSA